MFPVFLECSFISIHALREEGDDSTYKIWLNGTGISIHALREEGDIHLPAFLKSAENFYPRPPRGGRLGEVEDKPWAPTISIHALREEGDVLG